MPRFPFFFLLLSSLLLSACGGGGDSPSATPAAPQAAGLVWVDVQDGSGHTVMQHRYSAGSSANEELVTTTQYQGYDGVWGTADDWRTARTRCSFQAGPDVSPVGFGPDTFLGVSASLCTVRRALAGTVQAEISGAYLEKDVLDSLRPETVSETAANLFATLGWQPYLNSGDLVGLMALVNEAALIANYRIEADASGVRLCRDDCAPTGIVASAQISCRNLCGVALAPTGDGLVIDLDPDSCGASMVEIYDGIRAQVMLSSSRLDKVVYSPALTSPYCYVTGYDQNRYDSNGQLSRVETYAGNGVDGVWLNADDVRSTYTRVLFQGNERQRLFYSAAGEDGVWDTADDVMEHWQYIQFNDAGRLLNAKKCTNPGNDLVWQTDDDVCQVMIFHYDDEH